MQSAYYIVMLYVLSFRLLLTNSPSCANINLSFVEATPEEIIDKQREQGEIPKQVRMLRGLILCARVHEA